MSEPATDSDAGFVALGSAAPAPATSSPMLGGFGSPPIQTGQGFGGVRPASGIARFAPSATSFGEKPKPFSFAHNATQKHGSVCCCGGFEHLFDSSRMQPPSKDDPLSIFFEKQQIAAQGKDDPWSWDSRISRCSVDVVPNTIYFNTRIKDLDYTDMWSRKLTFRDNWSRQMSQTALEMAEAGFYFVGPCDHVKCAFCKMIIRDWRAGEIPMFTHVAFARISGYTCAWAEANFGALFNAAFCRKLTLRS